MSSTTPRISKRAQARSCSASELARTFGKARGTVHGWIARGCPVVRQADREQGVEWALDPAAVVDWLLDSQREALVAHHARRLEGLRQRLEVEAGTERPGLSKEEALRLKRVAEAALLELDLAERREQLVPAVDLETTLVALTSALQKRLLAIPSKAAPLVHAAQSVQEARGLLEEEIHEALADMAAAGEEIELDASGPGGTKRSRSG